LLRLKQIGTICFIISTIIFPTYATVHIQPGATADCDTTDLNNISNGNAYLTAQYQANTITFTYDAKGGTTSNGGTWSNDGDTQCEYDTNFNLPTIPYKTGYNFDGWKVKCEYNISTLDYCAQPSSWDATHVRGKQMTGATQAQTGLPGGSNDPDLNPGEWAVLWNFGEVKGKALCSSTVTGSGTNVVGNPDTSSEGKNCWCQATAFTPIGGEQCPVSNSRWILNQKSYSRISDCLNQCVYVCAYNQYAMAFCRRTLFGGATACP